MIGRAEMKSPYFLALIAFCIATGASAQDCGAADHYRNSGFEEVDETGAVTSLDCSPESEDLDEPMIDEAHTAVDPTLSSYSPWVTRNWNYSETSNDGPREIYRQQSDFFEEDPVRAAFLCAVEIQNAVQIPRMSEDRADRINACEFAFRNTSHMGFDLDPTFGSLRECFYETGGLRIGGEPFHPGEGNDITASCVDELVALTEMYSEI